MMRMIGSTNTAVKQQTSAISEEGWELKAPAEVAAEDLGAVRVR